MVGTITVFLRPVVTNGDYFGTVKICFHTNRQPGFLHKISAHCKFLAKLLAYLNFY